ncbi:hypothetical protein C0J56_20125 [Pseudomonas fluorescens]|nr:hypothetical protein C0J56_20125 [Pseudomonas fluorescens]
MKHLENCKSPQSPRGSGLAREGGLSASIYFTDTPHSRASPLPQVLVSFKGDCAWQTPTTPPRIANRVFPTGESCRC